MKGSCDICSNNVKLNCFSCSVYLCKLHNQKDNHSLKCNYTKTHEKIRIYLTRKYWHFMHKYFHKYPPIPEGLDFDTVIADINSNHNSTHSLET